MVFEVLGLSLYDIVKRNDYARLPVDLVRAVGRQLMQALEFLQSIKLVHTGAHPCLPPSLTLWPSPLPSRNK